MTNELSIPTVPDFGTLSLFLLVALGTLCLVSLAWLVLRSREGYAQRAGVDVQNLSALTMIRNGRITRSVFYVILAVHFTFATGVGIWLNNFEYMFASEKGGHGGIAAYLPEEKSPDLIRRAQILDCDWADRYDALALHQTLNGQADPEPADVPDDARLQAFNQFADRMESNFAFQAPAAVRSLPEKLNPVFAVLSAFFLVAARGLVQQGQEDEHFAVMAVPQIALLAFCYALLAYYAIISYHASTEMARALGAGRIVCTSQVTPFFVAQSQALSTAALGLLMLFVLSPRPIFRKL